MFGLDREMGYQKTEFFNQVPRTFKNHEHRIEHGETSTLTVTLPDGCVHIHVGPDKIREITPMVRMPYVEVSIKFDNVSAEEQTNFLRLFDTSYQKGGG